MRYKIRNNLIIGRNNGKIDIFIPEKSIVFSLNETASFIFEKIKKGIDNKIIIKSLTKKYCIEDEQALIDLKSILQIFKKKKLIK